MRILSVFNCIIAKELVSNSQCRRFCSKKYFSTKMSEEKEFCVEAPWGKIRGVTWGSPSQPPVLVVHGKLDVCTGFRPLVKLLPPSFYYVAVDLPGNGRSDHLPRGVRYTVFDLVPTVEVIKKKFGWDKFIYMGHSLGALIGKIYNIVHPNVITRVVELDPVPAHHSWDTTREAMRAWYHTFYGSYEETKYKKIHGLPETAPKYTYEKDTTREAMRAWYHNYYGSYEETKYKKIHGLPETTPKYTYEKVRYNNEGRREDSHMSDFLSVSAHYTESSKKTSLHHTWDTTREAMRAWYHNYYGSYDEIKYKKIHGLPETAPKYTYEKAQELMMKSRKMTKEASEQVLERCLEPVGDGLYRFTYDQRMKEVTVLPFSGELLKKIYTTTTTPTLAILAQAEIDLKAYENCEFTWDLGSWPNKNYSFKIVDGHHDVHVCNPQCLADDVARFLLEHLKAKL